MESEGKNIFKAKDGKMIFKTFFQKDEEIRYKFPPNQISLLRSLLTKSRPSRNLPVDFSQF